MAQNDSSVDKHAETASPWTEHLARVGYIAYEVIYVLVGGLALRAAFGGEIRPPARKPRCARSCSRRWGESCSVWSPSASSLTRRGAFS